MPQACPTAAGGESKAWWKKRRRGRSPLPEVAPWLRLVEPPWGAGTLRRRQIPHSSASSEGLMSQVVTVVRSGRLELVDALLSSSNSRRSSSVVGCSST